MTPAILATAGFLLYCLAIGVMFDGAAGAKDGAKAFATIAIPAWIIGGIIA